jgi:hypothetical protein
MARVRRLPLPKPGIAPNGIKYAVKYDRDWQEWQVRAYKRSPSTGAWKFAEGPTCYCGDRDEAINTFHHLVGYAPGYERSNPVVVKAQGYEPSGRMKRTEAVAQIRKAVKQDAKDCRRKFGTAIVEVYKNTVWEVRPIKDKHGPLWSRYSIHEV